MHVMQNESTHKRVATWKNAAGQCYLKYWLNSFCENEYKNVLLLDNLTNF